MPESLPPSEPESELEVLDVSRSHWRPRFSVLGLLVLTLIVALFAGLVVQQRQIQQANEILASHGLIWDRPLAADEFRLNVVFQHDSSQTSSFHTFAARIQTPAAGTFNTAGAEWFSPMPLLPAGDGVFTGEYFVQAELFQCPAPLTRHWIDSSRVYHKGVGDGGSMSLALDPEKQKLPHFEPLVKSGIYKRNTPVPLFRRYGKLVELVVQ